jgi:hypothetical protein
MYDSATIENTDFQMTPLPTTPEVILGESTQLESDDPNIALAPDEVATLESLIGRFDQVIQDLDVLNNQIETLLAQETIKACDS